MRSRRDLLRVALMTAVSALVPFACFAKSRPGLEQYERFRVMIRNGVTAGWAPVAFEDIVEGDLIRKASLSRRNGVWRVDGCGRQGRGILDVTPVHPSGPVVVDLLDSNLRVPRLST